MGAALGTATGVRSRVVFVATWMAILCAGTGLALTAATAVALSRLSAERTGIGSAVVQAFQKLSAPLGTAIAGSVLSAGYRSRLDLAHLTPASAATVRESVFGGTALARRLGSEPLGTSVRAAFVHGVDAALLVSAGIAAAGAILALAFVASARTSTPDHARQP